MYPWHWLSPPVGGRVCWAAHTSLYFQCCEILFMTMPSMKPARKMLAAKIGTFLPTLQGMCRSESVGAVTSDSTRQSDR